MAQPVCNSECQKQKQLAGLLTALNTAEQTRDTDPTGYEKAKVNYYTLKEGQGWLSEEKKRVAKAEIAPVLTKLNAQYDSLKSELSKRKDDNPQEILEDEYLIKELKRVDNRVGVAKRMFELGGSSGGWMSILIDVVIALLGLSLIYTLAFTNKISRFFVPQISTV